MKKIISNNLLKTKCN